MTATQAQVHPFDARADALLATLRHGGPYKHLQTLEGPMDAEVTVRGYGR